jgi:transcriptional regulator with XRE-family HTH domain
MSNDICRRFGGRIRQVRGQKNITQLELCHRIDMEHTTLSSIENGHMERCLKNTGLLADGLGVSLRRLFWDL